MTRTEKALTAGVVLLGGALVAVGISGRLEQRAAGKTIIVKDGTVEVHGINAKLEAKQGRKQKSSFRARDVVVYLDGPNDLPCGSTPVHESSGFDKVLLFITDLNSTSAIDIGASNEAGVLTFDFHADWKFDRQGSRFVLKDKNGTYDYKLSMVQVVNGKDTTNLKQLEQKTFCVALSH
jgi:hypothetical protein